MDDPVQTNNFIKYIIDNKKDEIIGLAVPNGDRLKIGKNKSKILYILTLLLIMGLPDFLKNSFITMSFKIKKNLSKHGLCNNPSITYYAQQFGIPVWKIKTPNSKSFMKELSSLKPDVIINQSQSIIKKELLEIPKIGVINRHNALLPKNRGRLTPFWVLYKEEKETGVSIHFVTEELDAGDIIVQKRFPITRKDNFNSVVKKNYEIAPIAMLEALAKLENGEEDFIKNENSFATYNTIPTIKEAWQYRRKRIMSFLGQKKV